MNGYLFIIIISLLFRLIIGSPRNKNRIFPFKDLKIEKFKLKTGNVKPRSVIYLNREVRGISFGQFMNPDILYNLYEMAETGKIDQNMVFVMLFVEIFESNEIYPYTPAEWAVFNGETEVIRTFLEMSEVVHYDPSSVNPIFTNLFALAIQRNKYETLKCILECTKMEVKGQGFLSIAAQHKASNEILNFLLNDCDLSSEIDETNILKTYLTPLNSCIKFNNFDAAILYLKHGASLTLNGAKHDSPLAAIFRLNKYRMLETIFKYFPEYYNIIDEDGDSLYHYAAIYSSKVEMFTLIRETFPYLSVNLKNKIGNTPLNTCFKYILKKEIILELISIGADIFHVPDEGHRCPLQIIMEKNHETYFLAILGIYSDKPGLLSQVVEYICEKGAWDRLEQVLEIYPEIHPSWFDFSKITFSALLRLNAWRTFRLLLRLSKSPIPKGTLLTIAESGSEEFFKIAFEHGADIDEISEHDKQRIFDNGNTKMHGLIEELLTEQKLNHIKQFNIE